MKQIYIDDNIRNVCPDFKGVALYATFSNSLFSESLWQETERSIEYYRNHYTQDNIKSLPPIKCTREVYRKLGKDPSRYRPSGESLIRRIIQGKSLYQINTAVDLINLASIEFGYSIGGFDCSKIQGESITLSVGEKNEPYVGIGRGELNIESMPVYRDSVGGFGTPTSDNERTKICLTTTELLALVNGYDGNATNAMQCAERMLELLNNYASCSYHKIITF
ncbi:MAG: phenylalanine--tRNA ligase beta subunit-related protein [Bacteroidaceae bacterium]|nr:phenylalanine--tRNA ligase beta subunit-related protein [Prevotellaceae bacterium]MDY2849981.1 phenylalanine--tRNA ligase beta subunit-related protein [Bacteroidaceae bacterium]